jgi:ketosteroid isomerase-like protein
MTMPTVEQNEQVIAKLYEAIGRGDMPAMFALVDADATWANKYGPDHFPGQWGKPARGHAEIGQFFQAIYEAVEIQGFDVVEIVAQRNKVIVFINWKGVIRRTGVPFSDLLVHIYTLRDGQVVDYIGLHDPTAYTF